MPFIPVHPCSSLLGTFDHDPCCCPFIFPAPVQCVSRSLLAILSPSIILFAFALRSGPCSEPWGHLGKATSLDCSVEIMKMIQYTKQNRYRVPPTYQRTSLSLIFCFREGGPNSFFPGPRATLRRSCNKACPTKPAYV